MTDATDPDDAAADAETETDASDDAADTANPPVKIPQDEQAVIAMLGEDATEQEKNLAIAQAELIGDI